jgi:hypothetical protein
LVGSCARKIASQSAADTLPDIVRFFTRERENVGQESFDALVHRVSPLLSWPALFLRRVLGTKPISGRFWAGRDEPTQGRSICMGIVFQYNRPIGKRIRNNVAQIGDRLLSCRCRNRTDAYRRFRCWPWRRQLAATGDMELAALC